MAKDHSFDIVSKVSLQELRNAVQMAQREIQTRFDFKGSSAGVTFTEEKPPALKLTADHALQLKSVRELVQEKLARRAVSLRAFEWKEPEELPGGGAKQQALLQQGLSSEKAKEIVKEVKGLGQKVDPKVEGDAVRVYGRQLDDLQQVMRGLKDKDMGVPLQFENYR